MCVQPPPPPAPHHQLNNTFLRGGLHGVRFLGSGLGLGLEMVTSPHPSPTRRQPFLRGGLLRMLTILIYFAHSNSTICAFPYGFSPPSPKLVGLRAMGVVCWCLLCGGGSVGSLGA